MKTIKKLLLSICSLLTLLFGLAITPSFGQSFSISGVYVDGDPYTEMEGHGELTNNSNAAKLVLVNKVVNNLYPGHHSYFCLVQCYDTSLALASDTLLMPALSTTGHGALQSQSFHAYLETDSIAGSSSVKYCFYDVTNPADSACVEYIYNALTGVAVIPGDGDYLSRPYPNPAINSASIHYKLYGGPGNAFLQVFNTYGALILSFNLEEKEGDIQIPVNKLVSGFYTYGLSKDGKRLKSGRLIVR
ncbi:MAG TPA: T9SS type A sorting domain-containing protein [Bacteroidia bacterium]|nr:T9SS type A sorting domain-containing protein [Bacteroidia bacterium]